MNFRGVEFPRTASSFQKGGEKSGLMLLKDLRRGMSHGERKREKWEQDRELKMKLLIGLGFKFGFVSIFIFPFPASCSSSHFAISRRSLAMTSK